MKMTLSQLEDLRKQKVRYEINGLRIMVKVLDAKMSYGNVRYLITPVEGSNEIWVNQQSVTILQP
jgi:hypothetical protein